ncbi:glycosyltransferase family 2 protein, partial [Dapis sp. BLCC M229]|uniref:glycosyltransferase family 2 protein n=1 Tax=Dapis sp. BLCC M229 TaxID=3400188 RepID=UPI003CE7678E
SENSPTGNKQPKADKNFQQTGSKQDSTLDFYQNSPTGNRPPQADENFIQTVSNRDLIFNFSDNSPTGNKQPKADKNFQQTGSKRDSTLDFSQNSPIGNRLPQADENFQQAGSNQDSTSDFSQNSPTVNKQPEADKNFQQAGSNRDLTLDFSQNSLTGNKQPEADKNFQQAGSNRDLTLDLSQNSPTGNKQPEADKNFQKTGSNRDLIFNFSENSPTGNRYSQTEQNSREKPSNQNLTLTFARGLIKYVYQENQGPSIARNYGIEIAQGEYIAFLDADDFFLPEKLAEQVGCFAEDSTLTMVQTGWRFVDEKGQTIKDVEPWKNAEELDLENWLMWQATLPSAMMFRSEWLKVNGGFDSRYIPEDLEIVLRLALTGGKSTWLRKVCVCYRQRNSSVSGLKNREKITYELEKLLDDFFQKPNLPTSIRQIENQIKYRSLLWNCWRLYRAGNFSEMATYLQKSLNYTSDSPTAAICTWIELFTKLDSQEGNQFNAYSFSQLPEWKKLISNMFNPVAPRVSVIIATYNNGHYILEAISSIFNQTYTSYEIIVIDDGSTDNTRQVLEPYLDKLRYVYQENKGVSHARNLGLEMARGEFISFLDADDFFLPDKLAKQVAIFDARPSLGIVHSGWRLINEKGEKISDIELWHNSLELDLETWVVWKPVTISMMFRKSWIKSAGGFDTRWHHGEDIDLVLRLSINGCEAVWLPKITYCYRQHHCNTTRKFTQQATSMMSVLDNFFSRPNLSKSIRQLEGKSRYYTLSWLAWQAHRNGDLIEMGKYLRQAGKYTPLSMTKTIEHWMDSFNSLYQQYGYDFDAYALTSSDVWQQLMLDIVITI